MSREKFKKVKPGDPNTDSRENRKVDVLNRLGQISAGDGMVGRHSGSFLQLGTRPRWNQAIVTITDVISEVTDTVADPPIYLGVERRYNFQSQTWTDQGRKWSVDAKGLDLVLGEGDQLVVYWDAQRGMFVPTGSGSDFRLEAIELKTEHPGKSVLFDVLLGEWSPSSHLYTYDDTPENTFKCIDLRNGVPFPDAGATGVGYWEPSDEFGRILVVLDLDCESEESGSSSSSQSLSSSSISTSSKSSQSSPSSSQSSQSSQSSESSLSSTSPSSTSQSSPSSSLSSVSPSSQSLSSPSSQSPSSQSSQSSVSSQSSQSASSQSSQSSQSSDSSLSSPSSSSPSSPSSDSSISSTSDLSSLSSGSISSSSSVSDISAGGSAS